ncbi:MULTISPECIES: F0F1 ATP synthase subunit A [Dialister]|jgi:F-type H+-transporting ATPase subunit a|uniref:ATP synthase subunit a n=1 Tax=Dialister hominis TaxID=2582419 RepID=A0A8D5A3D8_9FIRM|nr:MULTISPECIES: F0F1 ATP synthase subunit A [Dialister]MBS6412615.1 F0F1 ATP synthase subunit A [Dialister sp.]UYJ17719.1 MAG: F0F1 ATP synthase subunit A [Veillonellaceae bacterium]BBK25686.1 ATP synthase subunit a [Dialister hominis]
MHLHTGTHAVQQLLGMQVNMDTIFTTWLTALIVFLVVFAASRGKKLVPTGVQNCVEILVEGLLSQFEKNVGPKYRQVVPALLTLFLFILTANQLGLLPTEHLTASPTSDINTTLGLALAVTLLIHVLFIANQGVGKWIKHFFEPFPVFVFINLVEEISRPVTLAMRLFGNILAGEILLELLYALCPWLIPIIWIAFSVFVGCVQAYIFTTLSSVYLKHSL